MLPHGCHRMHVTSACARHAGSLMQTPACIHPRAASQRTHQPPKPCRLLAPASQKSLASMTELLDEYQGKARADAQEIGSLKAAAAESEQRAQELAAKADGLEVGWLGLPRFHCMS